MKLLYPRRPANHRNEIRCPDPRRRDRAVHPLGLVAADHLLDLAGCPGGLVFRL
jgi:hypothetical protein